MTLPIENHLIFNINGFEIVIISKRCKYRVKRMRRMRFCLMPFNDEVERFHLIRHRLSRRRHLPLKGKAQNVIRLI